MGQLHHTWLPDHFSSLSALPDVHEDQQEVQFARTQAQQSADPYAQSNDDHRDVHQGDFHDELCGLGALAIRPVSPLPNLVSDSDKLYQVGPRPCERLAISHSK